MKLHVDGAALRLPAPVIGRLTSRRIDDFGQRPDYIAYSQDGEFGAFDGSFDGYAALFSPSSALRVTELTSAAILHDASQLNYLSDGDVLLLMPSGRVNVLYRRESPHNTIVTTERCNSLCVMCTQPPRDIDDSYRIGNILRLLELVDTGCHELTLSGGEPMLLGNDFFRIVEKAKRLLPATALHVLTNGRLFKRRELAQQLASTQHPDVMLGIPLYSDIDDEHDFVVQAAGAFEETIHGIYNLAEVGAAIEIRVVIHALTYKRLPQLAEYIYRNLPFVAHVALMGMEMVGYVHQNFDQLWIDPVDYREELSRATLDLARRGLNVSIYNHQLCTIPREVWPFARKSISDWKNLYLPICESCALKDSCAGFFQSAVKRHSRDIVPISTLARAPA